MKKILFKNDDFEITPNTSKEDAYEFQLNLKGKKVATGSHVQEMWEFTSDGVLAETVLNFEIKNSPKPIHHYIFIYGSTCMGMHDLLIYFIEGKKQNLEFCFEVKEEHFLTMLINPTQVLIAFSKLAKAKGYKIKSKIALAEFGPGVDVVVKIPAKGNMYQHYKKHLEVFEALFQQAREQVRERINKN